MFRKYQAWLAAAGLLLCTANVPAGNNVWTEAGLTGGNVRALHTSDPNLAFARAGDKFYKSTDGGVTWTAKLTGNTERYSFALNPANPDVVVLQWSGFHNIQRSTNGGNIFITVSGSIDLDALQFCTDGTKLYATTDIPPYLRVSSDAGSTWSTFANTGLPAQPSGSSLVPMPRVIGVSPANANTLYLGFRDSLLNGIYKSVDGGANWTVATGTFGLLVWDIVVSPAFGNPVYAATESGLYFTIDGQNWSRIPDPFGSGVATSALRSVALDPADPNVIYAGGAQRGEIWRSADRGQTWLRRDQGVVASSVNSLSVRAGSPAQMLAGTTHTLYRSTDSAQTWNESAAGIRVPNVSFVHAGTRLHAGLIDGGVYESMDGATWTPLDNAALRASQPSNRFGEVRNIEEADKLFVLMSTGGLTWSTDNGVTWAPRPPSFNTLNNSSQGGFLSFGGPGAVLLATTNLGVERSQDDGSNWMDSSSGLPLPVPVPTRLARNADASEIYAGTFSFGVYKSVDGGAHWTAANGNLSGPNVTYIPAIVYDDNSRVLVIGTNDGAYYSRNGGTTYTAMASPTPGTQASVRALIVDDFDHGAIYLATTDNVYRSVDQGATWLSLTTGQTQSVFKSYTSLASDGPGVLYAGLTPGFETFTVAPDLGFVTTPPPAGNYALNTTLTWNLIVRNNGAYAATQARFSWQAPPNVTLVNVTNSRGPCSVSLGNLLDCDIGLLQPAQGASISLGIRGVSGGPVTLNPAASLAEHDAVPADNTPLFTGIRFLEEADLRASIVATPAAVDVGAATEYSVTVRNDGPEAATAAAVNISFGANDSYVLAAGSLVNCTGSVAQTLHCLLPPLQPGSPLTWRWTVTTGAPDGQRAISAQVAPDTEHTHDPDTTNNLAQTAVTVRPVNDIGVTLDSSANSVVRGTQVTYTIHTTNYGLIPAQNVTPRLERDAGLEFASATGASCTFSGTTATCDAGTLAPGATSHVSIVLNTLVTRGHALTASATSLHPDPNSGNNQASALLTVAPLSDIGATLAAAATTVTQNAALAYTLTVTNSATSDPTTVFARVTLGNRLTFTSATGATCTHASGVVTCNLASIAAGASAVVTINTTATTVGTADASADVEAFGMDPMPGDNNPSAATVTINAPPPPPPPPPSSSSSSGGGGGGGGSLDVLTALLLGCLVVVVVRRSRRTTSR